MAIFRFRAAAALDARRRQEDAASIECARKDGLKLAADRRCTDIAEQRTEAGHALVASQEQGQDGSMQAWHRNWITGLSATAHTAANEAAQAAKAVQDAQRVWQEARKKRLVLERLRDRALQRFRKEEARREQIVIDELARVRFTTRASLTEGKRRERHEHGS